MARIAAGERWEAAARLVDLLGVAQTAFALEAIEPVESREADALRSAATRFERLLRRRRDRSVKENPLLSKDARARFDAELESVRRYTHALGAEGQVALAVRDAFDRANWLHPGPDEIPTHLSEEGPLVLLTRAALYYTPVRDKSAQALRHALEKWPVFRRQP
ncbi:MAG: hypothetical protein ACR652_21785 [Methylocystis sp.]|uniref:hypothetical protein n=1 Tax=Methylocystis sp. TaxID=1911079 RepID=UPI003DA2CD14